MALPGIDFGILPGSKAAKEPHTDEYVLYHTELDMFMGTAVANGRDFVWRSTPSHDQMVNPRGNTRQQFETLFAVTELSDVYLVSARLVYHEKYKASGKDWFKGTERWMELELDHQNNIPVLDIEDWTNIGIWV
jgi:hypothetical protein